MDFEDELLTTVIAVDNDNNSSSSGPASPPLMPINSPGSSVSASSTKMKEEYSQLLKCTLESAPGLGFLLSSLSGNTDQLLLQRQNSDEISSLKETTSKSRNGSLELVDVDVTEETLLEDANKNNDDPESSPSVLEQSISCMRTKMNSWMDSMKEKIMEEMIKQLAMTVQAQQNENKKSNKRLLADKSCLEKQVNTLTEKINELECALGQKKTLVKNMTDSICSQKKKFEQAKCFYTWKTECADKDRECFTDRLACDHHSRKLALRSLKAWYGLIQCKWRNRVEHECQSQAKSVCMNLSSDYEVKVCMLNEKIKSLEEKVCLLQQEREMYSEQVKKAFMRGMCALNVETMSVLAEENPQQQETSSARPKSSIPGYSVEEEVLNSMTYSSIPPSSSKNQAPKSFPTFSSHTEFKPHSSVDAPLRGPPPCSANAPECGLPTYSSHTGMAGLNSTGVNAVPLSSSITATNNGLRYRHSGVSVPGQTMTGTMDTQIQTSDTMLSTRKQSSPKEKKGKAGKGKGKGGKNKTGNASVALAPPMASVVVERHQSINKQTLGKATAVRYPKKTSDDIFNEATRGKNSVTNFKPIAGQTSIGRNVASDNMYIKVVE